MEKDLLSGVDTDTISLEEGMDRTNFWRQAVKPLFGDDMDLVPKGFFVKFEDIKDLSEKYPHATGVRAYFTLPKPGFEPGEGVTGILVPVEIVEGGKYKDIVVPINSNNPDTTYSIYDFTKPCPDSCDPTSPLY